MSPGPDGDRDLRRSAGPGCRAEPAVKKTACGACGRVRRGWYDRKVRRVRDLSCGDTRVYLDVEVRRLACRRCGTVKQERLGFLADNPFYTKRFAFYVGRRCRASPIKDVAQELHLDWHTVKNLEKQYMREQLRRLCRLLTAARGTQVHAYIIRSMVLFHAIFCTWRVATHLACRRDRTLDFAGDSRR